MPSSVKQLPAHSLSLSWTVVTASCFIRIAVSTGVSPWQSEMKWRLSDAVVWLKILKIMYQLLLICKIQSVIPFTSLFSHICPPFTYTIFLSLFFLRLYLFIFRQRGREGEREGEKYQCVVASHIPPTGDLAHKPGMCPDWELNWRPFAVSLALNPLSHVSQGWFLKHNILQP